LATGMRAHSPHSRYLRSRPPGRRAASRGRRAWVASSVTVGRDGRVNWKGCVGTSIRSFAVGGGRGATLPASRRRPRGVGSGRPRSERGTVRAARGTPGAKVAREPCGWRPIARRERRRTGTRDGRDSPGIGTSRWYHDPVRPLDERVVSFQEAAQ
jgi:hypothetical protein